MQRQTGPWRPAFPPDFEIPSRDNVKRPGVCRTLLIFHGNFEMYAVQFRRQTNLARKPGKFVAVRRTVEQIILIGIHRWQLSKKRGRDMNMAGSTTAAATTQSQKLIGS